MSGGHTAGLSAGDNAARSGGLNDTPRGMRLHIAFFGRRNVGKSSLLNAITRQDVSIVSEQAGTTTDPVEKPMELLPLGPVLFIDTAGLDDVGALGELRARRTTQVFDRTDLGVIVTEAGEWGEFEERILAELRGRGTPAIAVFNKVDAVDGKPVVPAAAAARLAEAKVKTVAVSALRREGLLDVRQALLEGAPEHFIENPAILSDLVGPDGLAVLVVPVDKEAPRGRLILPQVQSIRDLLDADAMALVVKERELRTALGRLKQPPRLVVTDSQAFLKVAADTPLDVPMTSFSILFARFKGDLTAQVEGALALETLRPGDRILISEACSHHPIADDIGRVKIPRWLNQFVGGKLEVDMVQGHDFPEDLSPYRVVIHCGACTFNRRAMLTRILRCKQAGVPVTNYGLAIAYSLGIFERALQPFPAALDIVRAAGRVPAVRPLSMAAVPGGAAAGAEA
jgi:[FeFe] hydrogenase H-cluster maturation GTPase HydF